MAAQVAQVVQVIYLVAAQVVQVIYLVAAQAAQVVQVIYLVEVQAAQVVQVILGIHLVELALNWVAQGTLTVQWNLATQQLVCQVVKDLVVILIQVQVVLFQINLWEPNHPGQRPSHH